MRLHYLQHVAFEGPANIETWARAQGWEITATRLFAGESLPDPADIDWLVVMGGPMNIYEDDLYPWLAAEKKFLAQVIALGKVVLGVCLGAQLLADVLGGKVFRNAYKEIGWHPVRLTPEAAASPVFSTLPERFTAFHWHGDTFSIPPGAVLTAFSEACRAQAFEAAGGRVVGLQFHLESSPESAEILVQHCSDELIGGKFIQDHQTITSNPEGFDAIHAVMIRLLDGMRDASAASGKA